jgi:hypothetical protein
VRTSYKFPSIWIESFFPSRPCGEGLRLESGDGRRDPRRELGRDPNPEPNKFRFMSLGNEVDESTVGEAASDNGLVRKRLANQGYT